MINIAIIHFLGTQAIYNLNMSFLEREREFELEREREREREMLLSKYNSIIFMLYNN